MIFLAVNLIPKQVNKDSSVIPEQVNKDSSVIPEQADKGSSVPPMHDERSSGDIKKRFYEECVKDGNCAEGLVYTPKTYTTSGN